MSEKKHPLCYVFEFVGGLAVLYSAYIFNLAYTAFDGDKHSFIQLLGSPLRLAVQARNLSEARDYLQMIPAIMGFTAVSGGIGLLISWKVIRKNALECALLGITGALIVCLNVGMSTDEILDSHFFLNFILWGVTFLVYLSIDYREKLNLREISTSCSVDISEQQAEPVAPQADTTVHEQPVASTVNSNAVPPAAPVAPAVPSPVAPVASAMPELPKTVVGEVMPFHAPDGSLRGYMFEGIVYATQELAESAKNEKELRIVDGVLYATKEQADEERARKADIEVRTIDGVLYATKEQADAIRAERADAEACTVDGVRYATREQAEAVLAEQAAKKKEAYSAEIQEAARAIEEKLYDENENKYMVVVPASIYCQNLRQDFTQRIERWFSLVDLNILSKTKVEVQQYIDEKEAPQPLATFFLHKIDNRILELTSAPQSETPTQQQNPPDSPSISSSQVQTGRSTSAAQPAKQLQNKSSSAVGWIVALVVVGVVYGLYYSQQNKKPSPTYTPPQARQQVRTPPSTPAPRALQPTPPTVDWNSPYPQGYNYTSTGNELYAEPGRNPIGRTLNPNARVNILAQAKDTSGKLFYKLQLYYDGGNHTAWARADWMTVLPTGRTIPDETPAPQPQAPNLPKLSGDRPLTKSSARKGFVTALGLNVRADHDANSRIVAQAEQGASLSIVDSWQDGESEYPWYKIDDLSEWGWVYGKYVTVSGELQIGIVTLKSGKMNIHSDHTKASENIGTVDAGGRYRVTEIWTSKEVPYPWYRLVDDSDFTGWVSGRYFIIEGHAANEGYKLSDDEYNEFKQHIDFAAAEDAMGIVWEALRQRASSSRYEELLKGQKAWIARRRDRMATDIFNKAGRAGLSKRECYVRATQQRIKELQAALNKL